MRTFCLAVLSSLLIVLAACSPEARKGKGFSLPDGDPDVGEFTFVTLQCNSCHSLPSVKQLPDTSGHSISFALGGKVTRIKTYGELVTAIINPSHKIAQSYAPEHTDPAGGSAMRNYNEFMTVNQLIDLVSFLQSEYELQTFERSPYRAYYP